MNTQDAKALLADSEILCTADEVNAATTRVAVELNRDYADKHPLVLGVMGGAVVFSGQLLPQLDFPLDFDIVQASRYGENTVGTHLNWRVVPRDNVKGRHVLLLDDILDEGTTLAAIEARYRRDGAKQVFKAVLTRKDRPRKTAIDVDFVGLDIPDRYVFGYGMDYKGYLRNAPGIYAVAAVHEK